MPFAYLRTIHFPDTDAAGVVFFPNYFAMCHEAYEEALSTFVSGMLHDPAFVASVRSKVDAIATYGASNGIAQKLLQPAPVLAVVADLPHAELTAERVGDQGIRFNQDSAHGVLRSIGSVRANGSLFRKSLFRACKHHSKNQSKSILSIIGINTLAEAGSRR